MTYAASHHAKPVQRFFTAALLSLGLIISGFGTNALADDRDGAEKFIAATGDRVINALQDGTANGDNAESWFRSLITETLDIETMGRFTLGRHWRSTSPEQREEFLQAFEDALVNVYTRRLREYSGEQFEVTNSRAEGRNDVLVTTRITSGNTGQEIDADWRVRPQDDGTYKVIDFVVGNVSLLASQRSEYASVIQRNGGSIDALIRVIRAKGQS
ncbi:MAG: ABC transporter substrate-binding protein [Pseudomonadota bacterium]